VHHRLEPRRTHEQVWLVGVPGDDEPEAVRVHLDRSDHESHPARMGVLAPLDLHGVPRRDPFLEKAQELRLLVRRDAKARQEFAGRQGLPGALEEEFHECFSARDHMALRIEVGSFAGGTGTPVGRRRLVAARPNILSRRSPGSAGRSSRGAV
jgi:hypothetical protein